ncbi:hypothetical protein PQX77_020328 [Marasmius sp. AFHP31]|nr:hypothetical protein PQX77_020328 [Marasmius sp. AFHP31]
MPLPQASTGKKRKRSEDEALKEGLIQLITELEAYFKRPIESESEDDEDEDAFESFSEATEEDLARLGIQLRGCLRIKPEHELKSKLDAAKEAGKTEHWSSKGLYEHLKGLENLVVTHDKATLKRLWINAFLFRAAAISPPGKQTVLTLEENPSSFAGEYAAYTVYSVGKNRAKYFTMFPEMRTPDRFHQTLLVVEGNTSLWEGAQLPPAILQMHAFCQRHKRSMLRGALTNGREWIFILLKAKPNDDGFVYWISELHKAMAAGKSLTDEISSPHCDIIAGILAHWIAYSDEDISDDDWFILEVKDGGPTVRAEISASGKSPVATAVTCRDVTASFALWYHHRNSPLMPSPKALTGRKRKRAEDEAIREQLARLIAALESHPNRRPVESEGEEDGGEADHLRLKKSKLESPQVSHLSLKWHNLLTCLSYKDPSTSEAEGHLARPAFQYEGFLEVKPEHELKHKLDAANEVGKTELWSSNGLYEHLKALDNLIPKDEQAPTRRLWIDALLFRVAAMSPPGKQTVLLSLEKSPSPRGCATYGAFLIEKHEAQSITMISPEVLPPDLFHHPFLVVETKTNPRDDTQLPLALSRMHGFCQTHKRSLLRGALTNGREWLFILLKAGPNGDGFGYWISEKVYKVADVRSSRHPDEVSFPHRDIVTGVIAHWISHSEEDISDDDWFILI